jgi:hypothetical protein
MLNLFNVNAVVVVSGGKFLHLLPKGLSRPGGNPPGAPELKSRSKRAEPSGSAEKFGKAVFIRAN